MKYAIIDCRMSKKCRKSLELRGYYLIEIPENSNLDKPVSAHPDISVFGYKNILVAEGRDVMHLLERMFEKEKGIHLLNSEVVFEDDTRYPNDCVLNFAVCGRYLIGNMKNISSVLKNYVESQSFELIHVNQGYAKCNICVVNDNAIITEDKGIAEACALKGIDVLLLKTNSVKLDGYDYGFIGGASGTEFRKDKNIILFCGCIEKHLQYKEIKAFCDLHGAVPVSLSDEDLYDYGSIIILQNTNISNYIK